MVRPFENGDPLYLACSSRTPSEIVVPIFANGRIVGEIDVDSQKIAAFAGTDRIFLVARIVGSFFERRSAQVVH